MVSEPNELGGQNKTGFLRLILKNLWGLVTLVVVVIVCGIIVQVFKKPGQMSVLESQAMDMTSMVPPKGAVPVAIAQVTREPISGSVTYTGTVQAYNDEDVYPRVTGRVVKLPVYPGDIVKAGQLLVQLDPGGENSEYATKRQEAQEAEDAAMHNSGIAKSEFSQKKYQLEAAKDAKTAAGKALVEAEDNLAYWKPEIERQSALLKTQVISLDEYQKELAQSNIAQAQVEQAQAKLQEADHTQMAAQAELDTMIHHVGHQYSSAKQAQAALKTALIYEKYTKILAQDDGVVTKRLISPGVVVNPGMMILKVAYVKQVRIQAEVASEDAGRIRLGNKVFIKGSQDSTKQMVSTVTSIFPAADPSSRTFTVEALVDNIAEANGTAGKQVGSIGVYKFLPGEYVVMKITTGEHEGLTVPTSAIMWREGKPQVWRASSGSQSSAKKEYTCTMHPEIVRAAPGKCPKCGMTLVPKELGGAGESQLVDVQLGLSNADKTEIVSGLSEGDAVVYEGYANLQPGIPVVATTWGKAGPIALPKASQVQGNRLSAGNNWTHEEMFGEFMLKVSLEPPKGEANSLVVKVEKHGGGVVSGAGISVKTSMPSMGDMAGPDLKGSTDGDGVARLKSDLSSGLWRLKLTINPTGSNPIETQLDAEVP